MTINLIVAINEKNVIGKDNGIPWHCSEDLKNFKKITTGKKVVMGKNTFLSLGKPLPKRDNFVLTRNSNFEYKKELTEKYNNLFFISSLEDFLSEIKDCEEEVFVIGGSKIYDLFLDNDLIDKIYLSKIFNDEEGDVFFNFDLKPNWIVEKRKYFEDFDFSIYKKRTKK